MPLCGSSSCGCAIVSVPAAAADIDGALPTIDVAGNGTPANPWNLTLNDEWAAAVASFLTNTKAAAVTTSQTTASTSFTDLATVGPAVSCETGDTALVLISVNASVAVANFGLVGVAVSGATTVAAADDYAVRKSLTTGMNNYTHMVLLTGLNPGINTFTLKYRVGGSTGTFLNRFIAVIPLL